MPLPIVDGLTETSEESQPQYLRLAAFLAQRPGGSRDDIQSALSSLESAAKREGDERMRERIKAAIGCLRGSDSGEGEDY